MRFNIGFRIAVQLVSVLAIIQALPRFLQCVAPIVERISAPLSSFTYSAGYWFWLIVPISIATLRIAIGVALFAFARRIAAWFVPSNRPLCPGCMYDITGLPDAGRCPECGAAYGISITP